MARDKICIKFLIHLIGERPALWDKTSESYKDRALRDTLWREICTFLNEKFGDMQPDEQMEFHKMITKKWTHIRDSWVKSMKYGFDERTKLPPKPYVYHEDLKFLQKVLRYKTRCFGFAVPDFNRRQGNAHHSEQHELMGDVDTTMEPECNNESFNTLINHFKDVNENDDSVEEMTWLGEKPLIEDITKPAAEIETPGNRLHQDVQQNTKLTQIRLKSPRSLDTPQNNSICHDSNHCCIGGSFNENRHWSFFKGIFPSLNTLDDYHTLQFQAGVICLIQKLKADQKNLTTKPLKRKRERNDEDVNKMKAGKRYATRAAKYPKNPLAGIADDEEELNSDSDSNSTMY